MPRTNGSINEFIKEKKCKKCGKKFIPAIYHIFREGTKFYCSWTCYNHRHDKEEKGGIRNERLDGQ